MAPIAPGGACAPSRSLTALRMCRITVLAKNRHATIHAESLEIDCFHSFMRAEFELLTWGSVSFSSSADLHSEECQQVKPKRPSPGVFVLCCVHTQWVSRGCDGELSVGQWYWCNWSHGTSRLKTEISLLLACSVLIFSPQPTHLSQKKSKNFPP